MVPSVDSPHINRNQNYESQYPDGKLATSSASVCVVQEIWVCECRSKEMLCGCLCLDLLVFPYSCSSLFFPSSSSFSSSSSWHRSIFFLSLNEEIWRCMFLSRSRSRSTCRLDLQISRSRSICIVFPSFLLLLPCIQFTQI